MKRVIEAIKKHKTFLISAHVNLEGDSLGSQLAMKRLLTALGKEAFILDADSVPEHYKFLPGTGDVLNSLKAGRTFDAAMILDCPTMKRIGKVADLIPKGTYIINVDHHISNEKFGDVNWVDPDASSTGEMIYRLFRDASRQITKEVALYLYIAILTDTGSFNYDNTSSVTHAIVSELLGYGLDPSSISENIYERRSMADIKLLGMVLSSINVNGTGEVAYAEITGDMLRSTGADIAKSEGFVNYAKSIDTVKVAILFREDPKEKGSISVSFRSKGDVNVNKIASYFGGGGHKKASGCVIAGSLADAERKILAKVEEVLRQK
ncbi:MAG: bifunctional oligoribonuclease/PAP phosphatase NrnA [Candidatus Omnitrophota bacterium]